MPELSDAAALVEWMHAEYLSELLLRKASPKPSAPAKAKRPKGGVVTMEWGLAIPDRPKQLASYLVRAEGVTTWTLDGAWDKHGELELRSIVDRGDGIAFDMRVPGKLVLCCERVSIEAGPMRRYEPPREPDDASLLVWGPRELSWAELLQWLAPADGIELYRQRSSGHELVTLEERTRVVVGPCHEMYRLQRTASDERPSMFVSWMLSIGKRGHYFSITRDQLTDHAAWSRALRLPAQLDDCEVMSGGIRTTGERWLSEWVPRIEAELREGPLVPPVYRRAADET